MSGNLENGSCTGKSVTVNSDGTADISIKTTDADGFLAIYTEVSIELNIIHLYYACIYMIKK